MGSILNFVFTQGSRNGVYAIPNGGSSDVHNNGSNFVHLVLDSRNDFNVTYNNEIRSSHKNIFIIEFKNNLHDFYHLDFLATVDDVFLKCLRSHELKLLLISGWEPTSDLKYFYNKFNEYLDKYDIPFSSIILVDSNFNIDKNNQYESYYFPFYFYVGGENLAQIMSPGFNKKNELGYLPTVPTRGESESTVNRKYMFHCFNAEPREHRILLGCFLNEMNLLNDNLVSFIHKPKKMTLDHRYINSHIVDIYNRNIDEFLLKIPIEIDTKNIPNSSKHSFVNFDAFNKEQYLNTTVSIISESLFFDNTSNYTEKIYKPICGLHPFVVFGGYQYLAGLKKLGFKTFDSIWNEEYDSIENPSERMIAIFNLIDDINKMDKDYIVENTIDICYHNRNVLKDFSDVNDFVKSVINNVEHNW